MTAPATTAKASGAPDAQGMGLLSKWIAKTFAYLTPTERAEFMADAAAQVGGDLGKAKDMLLDAPGRDDIGMVEDQWSGAPDDHAETQRTGGPGSTARPGRVPVGRPQAASGDGAERMEPQYSRFAPQGGVQTATERLGREVAGMRSAMKSQLGAISALQQQIDLLVAAKAEDEEKMKKEREEKEAAKAAAEAAATTTAAAPTKVASETEHEMEEEEEKETSKAEAIAAAQLRIQAKSALRDAQAAIVKAEEMEEEERKKAAEKARARGNESVAKAESLLLAAKALRPTEGPSTVAIIDLIAKAKKALGAAQADNQEIWPASTERAVGKGVDPAVATATNDFAKALNEMQKAASGLSLLSTNMQGFMEALSGQSRNAVAGGAALPPAFNLAAKAAAGDITMRETAVMDLAQKSLITSDDLDRARDVLGRMRGGVPVEMIQPYVNRLPAAVQDIVLGKAA